MLVGIFGIATGSMGISYSKIHDNALFASALKNVMIMAWVTISFSFCIFFWIVVAVGMFKYYRYYPYAYVGELLCFMIQWGFLFYLINIYGHPGACCAADNVSPSAPTCQQVWPSWPNQPVVIQQPVVAQQQQPVYQQVVQPVFRPQNPAQHPVMVYQQPTGNIQQVPQQLSHQGQQNPAAQLERNAEKGVPPTYK